MKTLSLTIIAFFVFGLLFLSFLSIHVIAFEDFETITTSLAPDEDAYVNSYHPDEKKGDSSSLYVENSKWGTSKLIFIKFDLSNIPADASIKSAQLKLYGYSYPHGGDVSAYYVRDDSWREAGLTYKNRPNISNALTYTVEDISSGSWYSWDITVDAKDAFRGDKFLTEALIWGNTTEYGEIRFSSRESGWPPKLEITYIIPASPTPTPLIVPTLTPEVEKKNSLFYWIIYIIAPIVAAGIIFLIKKFIERIKGPKLIVEPTRTKVTDSKGSYYLLGFVVKNIGHNIAKNVRGQVEVDDGIPYMINWHKRDIDMLGTPVEPDYIDMHLEKFDSYLFILASSRDGESSIPCDQKIVVTLSWEYNGTKEKSYEFSCDVFGTNMLSKTFEI